MRGAFVVLVLGCGVVSWGFWEGGGGVG